MRVFISSKFRRQIYRPAKFPAVDNNNNNNNTNKRNVYILIKRTYLHKTNIFYYKIGNYKMPLDDRFSPQNSNKPLTNQLKPSKLIFKRSRQLLNNCPINTDREQLPQIEEKCMKRVLRKNKNSCSDLSTQWLKPGVSLPKLRTRDVSSKRPDAGEPYTVAPIPPSSKKLFDCARVSPNTPSSLSLKGSQFEEDVTEGVDVDNRDTIGPSKCQFLINVPSSELVFDDIEIPEEYHEPSHALQLWEIWIRKRKHMQEVTCQKLNRKPHDLLINQNESYRKIQEDKTMFTYAQLPKPDKWRGHPNFWKIKSKKKKHQQHKSNDLFQVETPRKCVIPEMEFVDIPRVIEIEKGYISEGENKVKNRLIKSWEECPYRRKRSEFFKKQRNRLKPNEIDVDELAVVGKQICPTLEVEPSELDSKTDTPTIYIDDEDEGIIEDRKSIACLVIDGIELKRELGTDDKYSDSNEVENDYTWHVEFGLNKVETFVERSITVENKGTMAIAYSWSPKRTEEKLSLNVIKQGIREPWFFFNKNSGIFLPGQIYHLKFYHHTRKAGNQTEIWFLRTVPELFATPESCRFVMTAVAEDDGPENKVNSLQCYLNKRVGESFIKKLLDHIIFDATQPCLGLDYIEYRSFFLERELFEYHNPKHYYHSSVVAELKLLFEKVSGQSQKEWDLSLSSLLKLTMANTSGESRNFFLSTISESSRKLFRPNHLAIRNGKNHRMAYQILCKMTSFIEKDYQHLRKCLTRKRKEQKERCKENDFGEAAFEEYGEVENGSVECSYYTNAVNLAYFQTMFYIKVYQHMCDAVEHIADILETNKFLEPMKKNRVNDFDCYKINKIL